MVCGCQPYPASCCVCVCVRERERESNSRVYFSILLLGDQLVVSKKGGSSHMYIEFNQFLSIFYIFKTVN